MIVTDASVAGMLDIHDRRPLVLNAEEARVWLDAGMEFEEPTQLANNVTTHHLMRRLTDWSVFADLKVTPGEQGGNVEPAFNEPIDGATP